MTPKQLNEIEARAQLCAEATLPGEQLRALVEHIQQLQQAAQEAAKILAVIHDQTYVDAEPPELRAQNACNHRRAKEALATLEQAGVTL